MRTSGAILVSELQASARRVVDPVGGAIRGKTACADAQRVAGATDGWATSAVRGTSAEGRTAGTAENGVNLSNGIATT